MVEGASNGKPLRIRIVGGTREHVERELNQLIDDYVATVWNFVAVEGKVEANVVLFHSSVVLRNQLAAAAAGRRM